MKYDNYKIQRCTPLKMISLHIIISRTQSSFYHQYENHHPSSDSTLIPGSARGTALINKVMSAGYQKAGSFQNTPGVQGGNVKPIRLIVSYATISEYISRNGMKWA